MTEIPADDGWWGRGDPPWRTWPGVTIPTPCERHADGLWWSPCGEYYFDEKKAMKPSRFFSFYLRQSKGEWAGKPLDPLPWYDFLILRPTFGWMRKSDRTRRFRNIICFVAKKNAKSSLASGLALYLLAGDGESGAEVYSAAGDEGQARIVFDESAIMARENQDFLEDLGVEVLSGAIVQHRTHSKYQVLTAKASTKHGFNVHGLILDELHTQKTRDLLDTLYKGTSARRQPVVFKISTAGDDRQSIGYEEYEYACRVRDGALVDPQCLPVVFEMTPGADWADERQWHRANPSLGVTKKMTYMQAECAAAKAEPRKRNSFLRLELNVWTESRTAWITPEQWAACARPAAPPDLASLVCCLGVDLSTRQDLTALVAVFRRYDDSLPDAEVEIEKATELAPAKTLNLNFVVDVVPMFWMPEETIRRRVLEHDGLPWRLWIEQGWLRVTRGSVVDYDAVLQEIEESCGRWDVGAVGVDPHNATHLNTWLLERKIPVVEVSQRITSISPACKLYEQLIVSGRLRHFGNPVMAWCVANAEAYEDHHGNIMPNKPGGDARGKRRIDGVSALATALSRLMVAPESQGYDENVVHWA